jgi:hypothetical protein
VTTPLLFRGIRKYVQLVEREETVRSNSNGCSAGEIECSRRRHGYWVKATGLAGLGYTRADGLDSKGFLRAKTGPATTAPMMPIVLRVRLRSGKVIEMSNLAVGFMVHNFGHYPMELRDEEE